MEYNLFLYIFQWQYTTMYSGSFRACSSISITKDMYRNSNMYAMNMNRPNYRTQRDQLAKHPAPQWSVTLCNMLHRQQSMCNLSQPVIHYVRRQCCCTLLYNVAISHYYSHLLHDRRCLRSNDGKYSQSMWS